jgi:hypothetical protein
VPRFFFHLKDGHTSLDADGTELPDIVAARKAALRLSGEILRDGADDELWSGTPWWLWVTDQPNGEGQTFITLQFSASGGSMPNELRDSSSFQQLKASASNAA